MMTLFQYFAVEGRVRGVWGSGRGTDRPPRSFHNKEGEIYKAATHTVSEGGTFFGHFWTSLTLHTGYAERILHTTMAFLTGLVLLVLAAAATEARVGSSNESSFCTETKECLLFDLVCKTSNYEVRHYRPTKWVSTDEESYFFESATSKAFWRLLKYITGANADGVKMDMTAPVLVKVQENKKIWESSKYTLSFLLPSAFQESAPLPTDPKVYFTDMPDTRVYVRSYGGWMLSVTTKLNSEMLTRDLDKVNATYNKNFSYAVGYNSPKKILNRHNEVWYIVDGEPVCSEPTDTVSDTE
ncbi:heme-binding protein 2 [Scleropages formosus]|uniref:Heme-binding protein 1 n=1 Tax=Scleropages formosus TaxID=113540 RepID=A0A8C9SJH5_SCLFO|nr:heme-binding protein 2-like [Scleropages formosus]